MFEQKFIPPIWVTCPHEGLRIRIAIASELSGTIADEEQLKTLSRFQRFGSTPANGEYIEGVAVVSSAVGLALGIHRRLYVNWIAPALDPALNFSRYFVSVLALPIVMTEPYPKLSSQYPAAVNLLETQRFATPSNLEFRIDSQV
ncbi:MAG TPA: hypothetical protein DCY88_00865 [Cyanobacteria bacterium UBA11372]|nr:hypothetical protein [Cyanobacteria bacterium UBA11372]